MLNLRLNLFFILEALIILGSSVLVAQNNCMKFSGVDVKNRANVTLDSIYVLNKTQHIDTVLVDCDSLDISFFTQVVEHEFISPAVFSVSQNYPNSFIDETQFNITLIENCLLNISISNIKGQKITSYARNLERGIHAFRLYGDNLAEGIYFIHVNAGDMTKSIKILKSGKVSGHSSEIVHYGIEVVENIPAFKSVTFSIDDLFLFIGYSGAYDNDTLDDQVVQFEKLYEFEFVANCNYCLDLCDSTAFWYNWDCYPSEYLQTWGIGENEQRYYHNDRHYSWYIDQARTGQYSSNNCGPSSVTMAAKWSDSTFAKTAQEAREKYPLDGGWWYTSDIVNYLNYSLIPNGILPYSDSTQIEQIIKEGCIIILCINTSFLRRNYRVEQRIDRFYSYASGHFLVVKGTRTVNDKMFIEVYDPNNWGQLYDDSTEKGANRHYRSADISQAISNWWNYIIVVYPKGQSSFKSSRFPGEVDATLIEHNWGRG